MANSLKFETAVRELATIEESAAKAADYRKRAERATTEAVKLAYLELARTWEDHEREQKRAARDDRAAEFGSFPRTSKSSS